MKTTAEHTHKDGTVCWYDDGEEIQGWWTQLPEDYVDPNYPEGHPSARFPTQNVPCPKPKEKGLKKSGDKDEVLVAGDEPHEA